MSEGQNFKEKYREFEEQINKSLNNDNNENSVVPSKNNEAPQAIRLFPVENPDESSDVQSLGTSEDQEYEPQESLREQPTEKKRRHHPDAIERMKKKALRAEHLLQQEALRLQRAEQRIQELERENERSKRYSENAYEVNLQSNHEKAREELRRAYEEGDSQGVVDWNDRLAEIQAQKEAYKAQQNINRSMSYQAKAARETEEKNREVHRTNEGYLEFLEENPWCDPNSPSFHQGLLDEANNLADELNKRLHIAGESHLIGTPTYYDQISQYMRKSYGAQEQESQERQPTSRRTKGFSQSSSRVAPVNPQYNGGSTHSEYAPSVNMLKPEERAFARSLPIIGPDGRDLSPAQKELMFLKNKIEIESKQRKLDYA